MMITVVESREFVRIAETLLDDDDREALIDYLAKYPQSGVLIQGTGGVRKLRWARRHSGKRGGYRVIYYYHSENIPLFLISMYRKNVKENLTDAERNALASVVKLLVRLSESGNG